MLTSVTLAALAAVCISPALGLAQAVPVPSASPQGITVVGVGTVMAQPTTARITLGVELVDPSLSNAQAEASRRMDAVLARLKNAGIPESDIHTTSYTITPQYDPPRDASQTPALRGYQVQNLVEARTANINGLGPLIDDVVGAGATRVAGIRFEADNVQALKDQARDQAMQNARAKAEQLARDGSVGLGRPVAIDESDTGGVTPVRAVAPQAAAPSTPIEPGELEITTTVRVTYAIQ